MTSKIDAPALLEALGVSSDVAEEACDNIAAAYTSIGRLVEFWLNGEQIWLLHTSNLDTPDPYGGHPIRFFTDVICAHKGLILLRLHTQHRNFPTDYFVYDHVKSKATLLPEIEPAIHTTSAMGLLCHGDGKYVAANLRQELDPKTVKLEMFLRCKDDSLGSGEWTKHKVNLESFTEDRQWGWQTGRVIPFDGTLLWVDLSRGILWSSKLPTSTSEHIKFFFVPLPDDLQLPQDDNTACDRPEQFRTVGCCDGEVKLVNLEHNKDDPGTAVRIWTLNRSEGRWEEQQNKVVLDYTEIMKDTPTTDSFPVLRFPVLSTDQSNTLYLTLQEGSMERLLHVDLPDCKLKEHCYNMNPPYPSDLGNRKPADKKKCRDETPIVLNTSRGHQNTIF